MVSSFYENTYGLDFVMIYFMNVSFFADTPWIAMCDNAMRRGALQTSLQCGSLLYRSLLGISQCILYFKCQIHGGKGNYYIIVSE